MKRKLTMMLVCLLVSVTATMAQAISGTVYSAQDGQPIIGATVKIKGSTQGVVTDLNGKFAIDAAGKTLVFSYVGMQTKEAAAKNGMKVYLNADDKLLDEVVVTAMGITRSEKSLGYAASTVKADELTSAHLTNVADALSGKVAGVAVQSTSSDPGAASNIIIRGFSSINGSNQPLYVVDGVPMQQTTLSGQGKNIAAGGVGNISPNDIASMTILKGAAATALYGSRAANGVVLITTREGAGTDARNFSIEYNGSIQARNVCTLPDFQNEFGQGWDGGQTYIENGSWGPKFDGSYQLYGPIYNGQSLYGKYSAQKSNVKDFFDTGVSQSHNISLSGVSSDKKMNYYLSYTYNTDNGIMPSDADKYDRNTIAFRGSYKATDWLKVSSSVNFAKSKTDAVATYQGTSVIDGLFEMPRNISIVDMKDTSSPFNTPTAYYTPYGITNPYWSLENNYNHTDAKQVYGKVQADITPMKDLTLTYRFGFDYTDYDRKIGYPEVNVDTSLMWDDNGYSPTNMNQSGYVYASYGRKYETNHDFLANYKTSWLDERLSLNVNAGLNINERYATGLTGESDELAIATGFWQLANGASWTTLSESQSKRRLVGLFGDVTLGWDDMLYLDLTARNDWSSTLPKDNNSYFYPGATLSWIFTRVIPENDVLTFGKLRFAYGKTGNDASPYLTTDSYVQGYANAYYGSSVAKFPMNGTNAFQKGATAGSTTLKPEMTTESEIGLDLQFFKGRIGIDFSYYNRVTKDQIFTLPVDPSTGYAYKVVNFGEVRNRGIELAVNFTPILTSTFRWDIGFNFAKNKNKVLSLPAELGGGKTVLYDFSAGNDAVYMYAEQGKPLGEFYTYLPAYWDGTLDADGNLVYNYENRGQQVVTDDGQALLSSDAVDTGKSINPDWTGGVTTSLSAYGFTLSAALAIQKGGYMFSRTKNIMGFTGNGISTLYNDRNPFIIPNSVYEDGTENLTPLTLTGDGIQSYYDQGGAEGLIGNYIIDRSYVKLRNLSLSYSLPKRIIAPLQLSDVTIGVFVNNLFTWTHKGNRYIDPENTTVSQSSYGDLAAQFGETYVNPSCRTWGINLGIKF